MLPYPLLFEPILKEKVWGGRSLEHLGKSLPPNVPIGESWELADLPASIPGGRSIIANGELTGHTLRDAIAAHQSEIMGSAALSETDGFPLLIKYLDARENLSVQVHPDEAYATAHSDAHLKSEAWYVLDAVPGAAIYKGLQPHVSREDLAAHIKDGSVVDDLRAVPVKPGDCHYLPSGTCHALGAGILVAEVQTPSDTTFRVYDWGRTDRELHIEQALQCIHFGEQDDSNPGAHPPMDAQGVITSCLVRTEYFQIERIESTSVMSLHITTSNMPVIWMVLEGTGRININGAEAAALSPGATILLPAGLKDATANFDKSWGVLHISLPSPAKGLIA